MEARKETVVLCGANSYEQKYYFNQEFKSLPEDVKKELASRHVIDHKVKQEKMA